jgi:hypothetical protein
MNTISWGLAAVAFMFLMAAIIGALFKRHQNRMARRRFWFALLGGPPGRP